MKLLSSVQYMNLENCWDQLFSFFTANKEGEQHRDKLDFGCYLSPTSVFGDNLLSCDIPVDFSISEWLRNKIEISRYIVQLELVTEQNMDQSNRTDLHLDRD